MAFAVVFCYENVMELVEMQMKYRVYPPPSSHEISACAEGEKVVEY